MTELEASSVAVTALALILAVVTASAFSLSVVMAELSIIAVETVTSATSPFSVVEPITYWLLKSFESWHKSQHHH